jgi:hypothetical protein
MPFSAGEAAVYWHAAKHFRLKSSLGTDTTEETDDLEMIVRHSDNLTLVEGARALLDSARKRKTA